MTKKSRRRFVVTFRDQYALKNVEMLLKTDFIGLGKTYGGKDPRVLFLYPFPHITEVVLKQTLDELQAVGALTYVEEAR